MLKKIETSLKNINYKLFLALLVMGLVPTIYTTIRVFWLGQLPGEWSFSIAGQLGWVNLFYEIIDEAIILPLFYFMGQAIKDKEDLANRTRTGLLMSLGTYLVLGLVVIFAAEPLLKLMAVNKDIIAESATYIRLESVGNIFGILSRFLLVVLVTLDKSRSVYALTGLKLALCSILDTFLISTLSFSANMGVNGIAISNIIVNLLLFITTACILAKEGIKIFTRFKLDFTWSKDFIKKGSISGLESLVRNLFYMVMISRMVNVVGEQGTYWVANNFIWGWLLLPVLQLGELIKQETALNKDNIKNNSIGYFLVTLGICLLWFILIPLFKPFMQHVLQFSDIDKLFNLVIVLIGFYVLFAFQNVFDATFYGTGRINYMLFESICTNTIYYGICFILYVSGVWVPTLTGIALMFGIGIAFDSVVSGLAYYYMLKKDDINLLDVEAKKI